MIKVIVEGHTGRDGLDISSFCISSGDVFSQIFSLINSINAVDDGFDCYQFAIYDSRDNYELINLYYSGNIFSLKTLVDANIIFHERDENKRDYRIGFYSNEGIEWFDNFNKAIAFILEQKKECGDSVYYKSLCNYCIMDIARCKVTRFVL